jgi:hypothetical protein
MMGSKLKLIGAFFMIGVMVMAAGVAGAFEVTQGILGTNQTACLDVPDSETADGTPIIAYPCNGGFNEQWSFEQPGQPRGTLRDHVQNQGFEPGSRVPAIKKQRFESRSPIP